MRWELVLVAIVGLHLRPLTAQVPPPPPSKARSGRSLAPCQACRLFVDSFQREFKRTERGKFEGGDAAWEEEKLGSYARSEVRLVDIQERLCADVDEHKERCHQVSEQAEPYLEEWWFDPNTRSEPLDHFFNFLCIEKLEACCPPRHYGADCLPCKGGIEDPCSGNGKCKGDGTRKGNGECFCDAGYTGDKCESCLSGYYQSYKDDKKTLCSKCHKSCKNECTKSGSVGCTECNDGWLFQQDKGCIDINECIKKDTCNRNQFCVNEEGTFKCLDCDKSCDECSGDGPDLCKRCASGFQSKDGICVETTSAKISQKVTIARYLTYFGLCITVCIIFQKSTILAGVLGLLVAAYISLSEYVLSGDNAGFNPTIDPSQIDFAKLLGKS